MNIIGYMQLYIKIKISFNKKESFVFYKLDQKFTEPITGNLLLSFLNEAEFVFKKLGETIGFEVLSAEFCSYEDYQESNEWQEYSYSIDEDGKVISLIPDVEKKQ